MTCEYTYGEVIVCTCKITSKTLYDHFIQSFKTHWHAANLRPVQSLTLPSHQLFCLRLLLAPFRYMGWCLCKFCDREACPYRIRCLYQQVMITSYIRYERKATCSWIFRGISWLEHNRFCYNVRLLDCLRTLSLIVCGVVGCWSEECHWKWKILGTWDISWNFVLQ